MYSNSRATNYGYLPGVAGRCQRAQYSSIPEYTFQVYRKPIYDLRYIAKLSHISISTSILTSISTSIFLNEGVLGSLGGQAAAGRARSRRKRREPEVAPSRSWKELRAGFEMATQEVHNIYIYIYAHTHIHIHVYVYIYNTYIQYNTYIFNLCISAEMMHLACI